MSLLPERLQILTNYHKIKVTLVFFCFASHPIPIMFSQMDRFFLSFQIFHLRDIRWERSQFLSKSFLGFLAFNLLPYSLFGAEIVSSKFSTNPNTYSHIFNGCYAALLLIVVVFFLIYGVEVFFKVRGGFVYDYGTVPNNENVNASQLHQSRFGLLSQAVMLIVIVGFLTSETLGDFWKKKVPVYSRNWHELVFRLVEVGVALWFPCCLWNSMAPEQLWILNPRKLLTRQIDPIASTSAEKVSGFDFCRLNLQILIVVFQTGYHIGRRG
jgi:von Hippel-Lindau disease tumor supressor